MTRLTTCEQLHGTPMSFYRSVKPLASAVGAWRQRQLGLLAVSGIDATPTENSTCVSEVEGRHT